MSYFKNLKNQYFAEDSTSKPKTIEQTNKEFNDLNNSVQSHNARQAQLAAQGSVGPARPTSAPANVPRATTNSSGPPANVPRATVNPSFKNSVRNFGNSAMTAIKNNPGKSAAIGAAAAGVAAGAVSSVMAARVKAKRAGWLEKGCDSISNPDEKVACQSYVSNRGKKK